MHQAVRATHRVQAGGGAGAGGAAGSRREGETYVGQGGTVQEEDEQAEDVGELYGHDEQDGSLHRQLESLHDGTAHQSSAGPASDGQEADDLGREGGSLLELFRQEFGQKCRQSAQYESVHGDGERDKHVDGVGQQTLEDLEDVHEVGENVWRAVSLVRPVRRVSPPVDAGGVAEDEAAHSDGPRTGDEEARPPGPHPE